MTDESTPVPEAEEATPPTEEAEASAVEASTDEAPPASGKYRLYNRIVQAVQDMYGFLSAGTSEGESNASPLILVIDTKSPLPASNPDGSR